MSTTMEKEYGFAAEILGRFQGGQTTLMVDGEALVWADVVERGWEERFSLQKLRDDATDYAIYATKPVGVDPLTGQVQAPSGAPGSAPGAAAPPVPEALGPHARRRCLAVIDTLEPEEREAFEGLLQAAGRDGERVVLSRALALGHPVGELGALAEEIRGLEGAELDERELPGGPGPGSAPGGGAAPGGPTPATTDLAEVLELALSPEDQARLEGRSPEAAAKVFAQPEARDAVESEFAALGDNDQDQVRLATSLVENFGGDLVAARRAFGDGDSPAVLAALAAHQVASLQDLCGSGASLKTTSAGGGWTLVEPNGAGPDGFRQFMEAARVAHGKDWQRKLGIVLPPLDLDGASTSELVAAGFSREEAGQIIAHREQFGSFDLVEFPLTHPKSRVGEVIDLRSANSAHQAEVARSKPYKPPTPEELRELERFRQTFNLPMLETVELLREQVGHLGDVINRLKKAGRIHEQFHRKGTDFATIDDVAGTCVVVRTLEEAVAVVGVLEALSAKGRIKVIEGLDKPLEDKLTETKRRFRTTGYVIEVDGKMVEVGVQTHAQRDWTELTHDTPVYKPSLFQQQWGMDDAQVEVLRDYAYAASHYLHDQEVRPLAADGGFADKLPAEVPMPAKPEAYGRREPDPPPVSTDKMDKLIDDLHARMAGS